MKKETMDHKENLATRLASYGITAGVLALTGSNASGQVYYSGIQNLVFDTPGVLNPLDLDNDGEVDFNVGLAWDSYIFNGWRTNSAFIQNPGTINGWVGTSMTVSQIPLSYYIHSSLAWTESVNGYYNLGVANSGNFLGAGNAFLAVRFLSFTPVTTGHYGWIRVNIDLRATELVVVDWAYEQTSLAPILCGVLDENRIPPEPILSTTVAGTVYQDFPIEIVFSEYVQSFELSGIHVEGGVPVAGSMFTSDHIHYKAMIRPLVEGEIMIKIPGEVVFDRDVNPNIPSANRLYINYIEIPIPLITAEVNEPVNAPFQVVINFNVAVTGLTESDFIITNGRAEYGSLIALDPASYQLTVIPENSGFVVIELPADVVADADMNGNLPSEPLNVEADLDSPHVVLFTNDSEPVHGPFNLFITFGEVVEGLHEGDLRITNGFVSAGTLETADNMIYTLDILPARSGDVIIHIPANAAQDEDGFGNLASEPLVVAADLPTALAGELSGSEFICFPNPSTGNFTVKVPEDLSGGEMILHNSNGTEVFRTRILHKETNISLNHLEEGIYLVHIVKDEVILTRKLGVK